MSTIGNKVDINRPTKSESLFVYFLILAITTLFVLNIVGVFENSELTEAPVVDQSSEAF